MVVSRLLGFASVLTAAGACAMGCGAATDQGLGSVSNAVSGVKCEQVQAKDSLIAELVYDSIVANYPLTRLAEAVDGSVTGPDLPDSVAGDLEILNTVPEALASLKRALRKVSGEADYTIQSVTPLGDGCQGAAAWTPDGTTTIDTKTYTIVADETNKKSWRNAHKEFRNECPLLKVNGNDQQEAIDPPSDGSTSDPPSATVSATGVTADAFGLCPQSAEVGAFCKLATAPNLNVNYTGTRKCQLYFGSKRCLLAYY